MMKYLSTLLFTCTMFSLTACSSLPKQNNQLGLLETVDNISVVPNTQLNTANLIRFEDKCLIEFKAELDDSTATEQWYFKGDLLMSAATTIESQGQRAHNRFDLTDPQTQTNFHNLKDYFKPAYQQQCD